MEAQRTWEIFWYEPDDKAGILALIRKEYGSTLHAEEDYFDWLVDQNPLAPPVLPVAREVKTGRVVGVVFLVPIRFIYQGEMIPITTGYNVLVDPEYRKQGVFQVIMQSAMERAAELGYHFFYTFPNSNSIHGLKKWNYYFISEIPLLIRPINIRALTKNYIQNGMTRVAVEVGWKVAGSTIWRPGQVRSNGASIQIVEEDVPDESYDFFWEKVRMKYKLMMVRDRTFLQWRFRDLPGQTYRMITARKGKEVMGYVVLSQTNIRGSQVGLIADFLVLPGQEGQEAGLCLLKKAWQRFREADLDLSGGMIMSHTQEYQLMKKAGYIEPPQRFKPQSFFLMAKDLDDCVEKEDMIDSGNWFVTAADHDAV